MNQDPNELDSVVQSIARTGIVADRAQLKEDMTLQFTDPREWIREYVVNAADANARRVWVSASEVGNVITVAVEDDGDGMDREAVVDFATVYRSRSRDAGRPRVGQHGIGKLSIAAMPNQIGFAMLTSTGTQCWRMRAGRLIASDPLRLDRVEPVPPSGTRFEISFAKRAGETAEGEIEALRAMLERYVRFLPVDVRVRERDCWEAITTDWRASGPCGTARELVVRGTRFEVFLDLAPGHTAHEIYQGRVLIGDRYNLLAADLKEPFHVPGLIVRVDSRGFELPFGRHAIANEQILGPLSHELRERVVPHYVSGLLSGVGIPEPDCWIALEEVALAFLRRDGRGVAPWCSVPLFDDMRGRYHTLAQLRDAARLHGAIYIYEHGAAGGLDLDAFAAPVLHADQSAIAREVLDAALGDTLVDLGAADQVIEAASEIARPLDELERMLAGELGFEPATIRLALKAAKSAPERLPSAGALESAERGVSTLATIEWRLAHLVERDGRTPATRRRFLARGRRITLNLDNPDVAQLVRLARVAPALAAHYATAMVIGDPQCPVSNHLTAETREELLTLDALARCGAPLTN